MRRYANQQLLLSEIDLPHDIIEQHVKRGDIVKVSSFIKGKTVTCRRCGTSDRSLLATHVCAKCNRRCIYCRNCIMLGKVSECEVLYHFIKEAPSTPVKNSLRWEGTLTPLQQNAADAVTRAIETKSSLLVWAVTGAGKTEIVFQGLQVAFEKGMRVLLATPRVDVVKELYPRLKKSFPTISMTARFGGSKWPKDYTQLVIATTHQVMRYVKAFDVVVVDEVDAFPYSIDKSLQYAVANAKKKEAATIYLTATPSKSLLQQVQNVIHIPRRYHGYPLPVPQFKWCGDWEKALSRKKLPSSLQAWLTKHTSTKTPTFLFVPTIPTLEKISPILLEAGFTHATVHAEDEERHEKVMKFRAGKLPLLVTTTILERGVTIPNVQVGVLGSEHDVFSDAALVQIAGRAGRAKDAPNGDVIFFHYGLSKAMKEAKRHIERMNAL